MDNLGEKPATLLVISDSHGSTGGVLTVLEWSRSREVDALVFLGDGTTDISTSAKKTKFSAELMLIRGNCDFDPLYPYTKIFSFKKNVFFLSHGHLLDIVRGYNTLVAAAKSSGANIALFGHTHIPVKKTINGVLLINPGSLGRPRGPAGPSFATIECPKTGKPVVSFWELGIKGQIKALEDTISSSTE